MAPAVGGLPLALVEAEVLMLWLVFGGVTFFFTVISAMCFDRSEDNASMSRAVWHCLFWCFAGCAFNSFVWLKLGDDEATSWFIGYVLEYILSFDNLFCFHVVFSSYGTPREQVYRGIVAAMRWGLCVRFGLFFIGSEVFNMTFMFRLIFGLVLLYSGVKVMFAKEEQTDPKENIVVQMLSSYLPFHDHYAPDSAFFVYVVDSVVDNGSPCKGGPSSPTTFGCALETPAASCEIGRDVELLATVPSRLVPPCSLEAGGDTSFKPRRWKATPLLLTVFTLLTIDAVFAVDSVTAKVSMVSQYDDRIDLFLNFSSTAFAMLCMPSVYFILAMLVDILRFLKYGLGTILILIGLKLLSSEHFHVREDMSCLIMLGILGVSVSLSVLLNETPAARSVSEDTINPDGRSYPAEGLCSEVEAAA